MNDHIYDALPSLLVGSANDLSDSGVPMFPLQFQTEQQAPPFAPSLATQHDASTLAHAQPSSSQHPPSASIDDILLLKRKIDYLTMIVHAIVQYLHIEVHNAAIDVYGNY